MTRIALSGYARSGKDAMAAILVEKHGYLRVSFADPMREALLALNPLVPAIRRIPLLGYSYTACLRLSDLVGLYGWDRAKVDYPEIRELLQRFGTEVGRNLFGEDFWVGMAMRKAAEHPRVVFSDCRFGDEARAVLGAGGAVVRVVRPGVGPVNAHVSDRALPDELITHTLLNDGTLEDLAAKVGELVERL